MIELNPGVILERDGDQNGTMEKEWCAEENQGNRVGVTSRRRG